jgi:hypothetical protein
VSTQLKKLNNHYIELLKDELKEVDYIGLTFDFCSNRHSTSFLCITGHWFKDKPTVEYMSKIIHFSCFRERHTAINIAAIIKEKLMNLGIYHKVVAITCDGARNVIAAVNQLDGFIKRIWCCTHRLHLVVINALSFWNTEKQPDNDDKTTHSPTVPSTSIITSPDVISKNHENLMEISWCSDSEPGKLLSS